MSPRARKLNLVWDEGHKRPSGAKQTEAAVRAAAQSLGIRTVDVRMVLSAFLAEVAVLLSQGECVHFSKFGLFVPVPRQLGGAAGKGQVNRVRFVPHRSLRKEVAEGVPMPSNAARADNYRANHRMRPCRIGQIVFRRVPKTSDQLATVLRKNLEAFGVPMPTDGE